MKFGLFCLTFQYFRAMTLVRREKISWTDAGEQIGAEYASKKKKITIERTKMMEENRLEAERSRNLAQAMTKAKEGEERKLRFMSILLCI